MAERRGRGRPTTPAVQRLELALEASATGMDMRDLEERRRDAHRRRETFLRALVDAHTTEQAIAALQQARIDHLIDVTSELSELLDETRVGEPIAAGASA